MPLAPNRCRLLAVLAVLLAVGVARATPSDLPAYLPRYRVAIDLDVAHGRAHVRQEATWTNPTTTPTDHLVFNVHSRYVVPEGEIGFMAKMIEILRVQPSEALGTKSPPCDIHKVMLGDRPLPFRFEGDTQTAMVVPLPKPVAPGESVTVLLHFTFHIPPKQGRWSQWEGVTTLANWLPVFAYYGCARFGLVKRDCPPGEAPALPPTAPRVVRGVAPAQEVPARWVPVPFVPWHQPFLNESGNYAVALTLPCDQQVASTGCVRSVTPVEGGKKLVHIEAFGVREFTLLCSTRYKVCEGEAPAGPNGAPVRVRILAFPEHEFYARHMVRIATDALVCYSRYFGPYPWPEFTVAESYFGWNGNECSTLVMIDERIFAMPHLAIGYVEYLLSHEICHQWWYNLVGTNGYCETWMDEGLASYFSHRFIDRKVGKNNALLRYPTGLEWLPNIRREDYRCSSMYSTLGKGEMTPVIGPMPQFQHLANLFNVCYDKGGRVVGMLEERLGESAFLDFMRIIYTRYRYRILTVDAFQRELEIYTGRSWQEFFDHWLYSCGMSDWSVEKVTVTRAPSCVTDRPRCCLLKRKTLWCRGACPEMEIPPGGVRLAVTVQQLAEYDEPTTLGISLADRDGYPIRIPILPGAESYELEEPPCRVTPLERGKCGGARFSVEVVLPCEPTQVAIDPDQVLVDTDPSNNYWHQPIRWRITPLYTFLEETDLTNAYDRWNVIAGPWIYGQTYGNAWFTRPTMIGARAGLYRTQEFSGGVYTGYRTTWRDVVSGVDGQWEHWPFPTSQSGFILERRLAELNNGDDEATRAVAWTRYIFAYNSSLYLPPIHFLEGFAQYSDNFLPFPTQQVVGGVRFDRTTTLGLHYRLNYLTPYWDPEGGFSIDAWYEGGVAQQPSIVGVQKLGGHFSIVKAPPTFRVEGSPAVQGVLDWFGQTRFAFRAYAAVAGPRRGEFFTMGGSDLFRGFDLAQRQGSTVWVGSLEWRVPLAKGVHLDVLDHIASLRNVYAAGFYDIGDASVAGRSAGPVAHGVGVGLRLDVSWLSFVERTTLRMDFAKALNQDTGVQVWLGINHPF